MSTENNDSRVRLTILGLSYSQIHSGAYALILAQADGPYRIPVVVGPTEAQAIALQLENLKPTRPMTHDLFVSFAHAFGVKLIDVFIYKFEDGVFSSELTFSDGERTVAIDSRTSDAIAIAMRTGTPIYTTAAIVEETGFIMEEVTDDDDGNDDGGDSGQRPAATGLSSPPAPANDTPRLENYAIEELERELAKAIENENYEQAAKINKIIDAKRNKRNNNED